MNKKRDYRVVQVKSGYIDMFAVKKRFLWFFWKTVKNNAGFNMLYATRRGAQAYINLLK